MNTATVELGMRSSLFSIWSKSNIVLRGLTFQYANSCRNDPAVSAASSANILFDHDFFFRNNSVGLGLTLTTNTTVQNSVANYNGTSGMNAYETKYDLWQDSQTRYNGWRGAQGVYYEWGIAGMHSVRAHNQTVKNIDSSFNQTFGFHWDTDHENVTADSLIASENLLGGGFIEKNEGPMTVSNSYFCNGSPDTGTNNLAFELRHSTYITFTGNAFVNARGGFLVVGQIGGTPVRALVPVRVADEVDRLAGLVADELALGELSGRADWLILPYFDHSSGDPPADLRARATRDRLPAAGTRGHAPRHSGRRDRVRRAFPGQPAQR